MEVRFEDAKLDRLETDPSFTAGFGHPVVKQFRKRMQQIRSAKDERDLRAHRSLHYEKMKSGRNNEHSMRLNDQWRLVTRTEDGERQKVMVVIRIEDYH
jgi:toxin HigB-1